MEDLEGMEDAMEEGHDHTGKHKHKEVEQEEPQNTGGHEDVHKHEYNQEKFT